MTSIGRFNMDGIFLPKAQSILAAAGGDPGVAGPLAEWARAHAANTDHNRRCGVLVSQAGEVVGETWRHVGVELSTYYATAETVKRWGLRRHLATEAAGEIARKCGAKVIHVTHGDIALVLAEPARYRPDEHRMQPGELYQFLDLLGLSQAELARRLGVREDTVRKWASGAETMSPKRLPDLIGVAEQVAVGAGEAAILAKEIQERITEAAGK